MSEAQKFAVIVDGVVDRTVTYTFGLPYAPPSDYVEIPPSTDDAAVIGRTYDEQNGFGLPPDPPTHTQQMSSAMFRSLFTKEEYRGIKVYRQGDDVDALTIDHLFDIAEDTGAIDLASVAWNGDGAAVEGVKNILVRVPTVESPLLTQARADEITRGWPLEGEQSVTLQAMR